MKKAVTRGLVLGFVAALGLTTAGCSSDDGEQASVSGDDYTGAKVEITFWNGWTGGAAPEIVPELIDQFNAEHDNIVVTAVSQEWADIAAKMPLAIQSGDGPDVAVLHGDDIATYAAQGLLVAADDIVDTLGYTADDFPPTVSDMGNYDGSQYAVPWSVTPLGLYVNSDVLSSAGITDIPTDQETYSAALQTLAAAGVQGEWVDSYEFTGLYEFESLLWQFGGDLYNDDVTEATYNSEAGVEALTWMKSLIDDGYSPANVAQDGNFKALVSGEAAFNWNGVWNSSDTSLDGVDWTAVAVPQIGTEQAVWSSSTHWVFPNNDGQDANKTAAAATFVKWMNDNSAVWAETAELPAANSVREDPQLVADYPELAAFIDELDYAHYETVSPGISDGDSLIITALSEALTGKKTPQEALDDAKTQADKILEQNSSKYGG